MRKAVADMKKYRIKENSLLWYVKWLSITALVAVDVSILAIYIHALATNL